MIMSEPERLAYTIPEAAKALGIHVQTLRRYVKHGILPSVRIGGRVLIPAEALRRMLKVQEERR